MKCLKNDGGGLEALQASHGSWLHGPWPGPSGNLGDKAPEKI